MQPIGLFYGSTNGTTAQVAERIQSEFGNHFQQSIELLNISEFYLDEMLNFDRIILGISTWNHGQLQRDWEEIFEEFDTLDLSGKQVALFGLGDQVGYPDTFVDALFFLADKVRERGATLFGKWAIEGYHFQQSWAVEDGKFLGLVIDEENQPEQSDERISRWVAMLMQEIQPKPTMHNNE